MEKRGLSLEFRWIKAHAGYRVNELAVQNATEGARNKNIEECYKIITKSVVLSEENKESVKW